jgi:hypothetical protein
MGGDIIYFLILLILIIIILYDIYIDIYKRVEYLTDEPDKPLKYVSSRGILKACDIKPRIITSSTEKVTNDFSKIKEGSVVYVHGSAIPRFILHELPHRIILVSGDCDESIPNMVLSSSEFKKFIESDKIIHWFSQNAVIDHPKLTRIPIGMDYHSKENPSEQEATLIRIRGDALPFNERKIKCYSNFHFTTKYTNLFTSKFGYDRLDAIGEINRDLIFYEPSPQPRIKSWENQAEYAFVVSPHGNGLDCHRTWEALILGCIPIVKTSPIDSLFDELPVLIVDEWSDISQELLDSTVESFSMRQFNYKKLELSYWMNKIRSVVQ